MWLRLLEKNIDSWGYTAITATNGQQAWDTLQSKQPPGVAILDWRMPELDGVEICHRVRQSLHLPFIYTLILTSRNTREDMVIGLEHAVASGQAPIHAHRKDEPSAAVVPEDLEEPDESCPIVWKDSPWGQPLFWFAIVGWILVGVLLVVFILYAVNR